MIANQRLEYLFQQRLLQKNNPEEKQELLILMADPRNEDDVKELLSLYWEEFNEDEVKSENVFQPGQGEEILNRLLKEHVYPTQIPVQTVKLWPRIAAVAAAVAVIVLGVYFFNYNSNKTKEFQSTANIIDIAPGKVGATLTLASGKKIRLTDAANRELANEAGVAITKSANGLLIYEIKGSATEPNKINMLSTAKGETYQVRLPDGSFVWLNAASSLSYPANFSGDKNRVVILDGEGYFEVAKDKAHPFVVHTDKQSVEVLGTHFNISSYSNEPVIRTTLLEGSVKVAVQSGKESILKPNEQSVVYGSDRIDVVSVNAEDVIAWKNGLFVFESETLESIMRKVARWYNVEVIYKSDKEKNELFSGSVSRFANVSELLRQFENTGPVKFKIEGKRVYVGK